MDGWKGRTLIETLYEKIRQVQGWLGTGGFHAFSQRSTGRQTRYRLDEETNFLCL